MSDQINDDDDNENKPMKIVFAEGCFDDFDGTQEELDELISQLTAMAESGELLEKSMPIDNLEDIDDEVLLMALRIIEDVEAIKIIKTQLMPTQLLENSCLLM